jgi:hypothetical protein
MKKIIGLILIIMVLLLTILPSLPVVAEDSKFYESLLNDNPSPEYPDILKHGDVVIDANFVVKIDIKTDAINKTYNVLMDVGAPNHRYNVDLGEIITDKNGKCTAYFNLEDYDDQITTMLIIGPYFRIMSPDKPFPEFDTSYPVFVGASPPSPGQIIIETNNTPLVNNGDQFVVVDMSYGQMIGYPNGLRMYDGDQIASGFILMPGIYTVTENVGRYYNLESIDIDDPSGDSMPRGRTAIINLKPGETVTVTFNSRMTVEVDLYEFGPPPPPSIPIGVVGKTYFTIIEDQDTELIVHVNVQNGAPDVTGWDIVVFVEYGPPFELPADLMQVFQNELDTDSLGQGDAIVQLTIDPPSGTEIIRVQVSITEEYGTFPPRYGSSVEFNDWSY